MNNSIPPKHTYICQTEYHLLLALSFAISRHKKYGYRSLIVVCYRILNTAYQNIARFFPFIDCIAMGRGDYVDFNAASKKYTQQRPNETASWLSSEYPKFVEHIKKNVLFETVYLFWHWGIFFDYLTNDESKISIEIIEDGLLTHEVLSPYSRYLYFYVRTPFPKNIVLMPIIWFLESKSGSLFFSKFRPYIPKKILIRIERIKDTSCWSPKIQKIHLRRGHTYSVHRALKHKIVYFDFKNSMESIDLRYREEIIGVFLDDTSNVQLRASLKRNSGLLITQSFSLFPLHAHPSLVVPIFQKILHKYFSPRDSILVKPHPSKQIDWKKVFASHSNVEVLEASFPLEIINWYPTTIQKAVAIQSTALHNLYAIPHKIEVWNERFPRKEKDFKKLLKYLDR